MKLTDGLEGNIGERCTEVVVEEAFEDVERDVREAGVNVGVDSQDYSVSPDDAAGDNVSLMARKLCFLILLPPPAATRWHQSRELHTQRVG